MFTEAHKMKQPLRFGESRTRNWFLGLSAVCVATTVSVLSCRGTSDRDNRLRPQVYVIAPGDRARYEIQERLIDAVPGDVIQLEAGTYRLPSQLDVIADGITIRGRGADETILSFREQNVGSEGIVATGDAFVIEHLAVEDSAGNAIKVLGADGVVFRGVRTEWTRGPHTENGAYGIYPVQCSNVLIEDCVAIGASDAGIYVGQSRDVVVRRSRAERNVAGIEIENTIRADVYENTATGNTGGLLVFDLPGLQVTNGSDIRVFRNKVIANNLENFAPAGNIVASVPAGTGLMIMASDRVEVFENEIRDNQTSGISIVSYLITGRPIKDPNYDPYPEGVSIHNNMIAGGGDRPAGELAALLADVIGSPFPQIFFDGIVDAAKLVDGELPAELSLRLANNGDVSFANANVPLFSAENVASGRHRIDRDPTPYSGVSEPLERVELAPLPPPSASENPAVLVYRRAPERLSEWALFEGNGRSQTPADGVFRYDLNTQLFSDYTAKHRFIRLPPGESMAYDPNSVFEFPAGTVIAKTFTYPHDLRHPEAGERLIETRIEHRTDTGWYGFSYIWNDDETEAALALGGGSREVRWIHHDGSERSNAYQIPNANQCITCHNQSGRFVPLGPTAGNLNRPFEKEPEHGEQLAHWTATGLLTGAPELSDVPATPVFDDPSTGTVAERARAWLDVNCAHCHSPEGSARTSGLDLRLAVNEPRLYGVWKSPVAAGRGSGGRKFDIVPGKPDESILLYRLESDELGVRMPNLARNLAHPESIALIREWIGGMRVE